MLDYSKLKVGDWFIQTIDDFDSVRPSKNICEVTGYNEDLMIGYDHTIDHVIGITDSIDIEPIPENLIAAFMINGEEYWITGSSFDVSLEDGVTVDDIIVTKNGTPVTDFGVTFSGHKQTCEDLLDFAISECTRNKSIIRFMYTNDKIKRLVTEVTGTESINKDTPVKRIMNQSFDILELQLVFVEDGTTWLAYAGDDEVCMLVNSDTGEIATDMENFFVNGIIDGMEKDGTTVTYITKGMKMFLEDYDITVEKEADDNDN